MFIVLDNAESVLDPHVTGPEGIYAVVEELIQQSNICLCIISQVSTVPPDFKWLYIPTLSMEAACDTFYRIYQHQERSDLIKNILKQLDFHPLAITLLATATHHNKWDTDQLAREWDEHRTDILQTHGNKGLAATIRLSLSSLMFRELGPDARDLLGVVAFFPQGVDENNIDWLFPTIPERKNILDKFCVLSLAYRSDGFITMLAPIRDHFSPKDPASVPLLCSTKERYFSRLSVDLELDRPGFEEARWIASEDVNVEHLLDVFTTIDVTSSCVWRACRDFMDHLLLCKPRLVVLGPNIEALADDHPAKLECIRRLSELYRRVANYPECIRLLTHALKLSREQGDDDQRIQILTALSVLDRLMGFADEAIQHGKEASEIFGRFDGAAEPVASMIHFAQSLVDDNKLDGVEQAASRTIYFLSERGEQSAVCWCQCLLGTIYQSKGEFEKAVYHFQVALDIASLLNEFDTLAQIYFSLTRLYVREGKFYHAQSYLKHAKSHAINNNDAYLLATAMGLQALVWCGQHRLEEAKSEALRAVDAFKKLGAMRDVETAMEFLQQLDLIADELDADGEVLTTVLSIAFIDSLYSDRAARSE